MSRAALPRRILQFWHAATIPADVAALMRGWRHAHPGHAHLCLNDAAARAFVRRVHAPRVAQALHDCAHPVLRADLIRYAWLAVHGGVYIDADERCIAPLGPLLQRVRQAPGVELMAVRKHNGCVSNSLLAAPPGSPLLWAILERTVDNILQRRSPNIWEVSGPGVVDALVRAAPPERVRVVPLSRWRRHARVEPQLAYKSRPHWSQAQKRRSIFRVAPAAAHADSVRGRVMALPRPAQPGFLLEGAAQFAAVKAALRAARVPLVACREVRVLSDPQARLARWWLPLAQTVRLRLDPAPPPPLARSLPWVRGAGGCDEASPAPAAQLRVDIEAAPAGADLAVSVEVTPQLYRGPTLRGRLHTPAGAVAWTCRPRRTPAESAVGAARRRRR